MLLEFRRPPLFMLLLVLVPAVLPAQIDAGAAQRILDRLDRLEAQNRALMDELKQLRGELAQARASTGETSAPAQLNPPQGAAPATQPQETGAAANASGPQPAAAAPATVEERIGIAEHRIEELSQEKVSVSQRLPFTITGMALLNTSWAGRANGGAEKPLSASLRQTPAVASGTFRQSVIGFTYEGPQVAGGATVRGTLYLDLFGGTTSSLNHLVRLRTASMELDWANTTLMVGQDKPLIAPREPMSLSQVAISPLTAAGNLWLWQPQVRLERRFHFSEHSGMRAQASIYQTSESSNPVPAEYAASLAAARPGWEGRVAFWKDWAGDRTLEFAPVVHVSDSHVQAQSVPSRIGGFDWLFRPWAKVDFSGAWFKGQNVTVLGSLRQGITFRNEHALAVRTQGGWAQIAWRATPRLTFHVYGGEQDDVNRDLAAGAVAKNMAWAANASYRLGSNVLAGFEAFTARTTYVGTGGARSVNVYDLSLAYLF
jgi:hypothetical protein